MIFTGTSFFLLEVSLPKLNFRLVYILKDFLLFLCYWVVEDARALPGQKVRCACGQ